MRSLLIRLIVFILILSLAGDRSFGAVCAPFTSPTIHPIHTVPKNQALVAAGLWMLHSYGHQAHWMMIGAVAAVALPSVMDRVAERIDIQLAKPRFPEPLSDQSHKLLAYRDHAYPPVVQDMIHDIQIDVEGYRPHQLREAILKRLAPNEEHVLRTATGLEDILANKTMFLNPTSIMLLEKRIIHGDESAIQILKDSIWMWELMARLSQISPLGPRHPGSLRPWLKPEEKGEAVLPALVLMMAASLMLVSKPMWPWLASVLVPPGLVAGSAILGVVLSRGLFEALLALMHRADRRPHPSALSHIHETAA